MSSYSAKKAAYQSSKRARLLRNSLKMSRELGIPRWKAIQVYQRGECEICGEAEKPLALDHCHETGKVRGLLCSPCNLTLGHLEAKRPYLGAMLSWINRGGNGLD